jgi:hypothetical protein
LNFTQASSHCIQHWSSAFCGAAGVAATIVTLAGCGPDAGPRVEVARRTDGLQSVQQSESRSENSDVNAEKIARDIVGKVVKVTQSSGVGGGNEWTFDADEFRRIVILERTDTPRGQTLVIYVTTQNNPAANEEQVQVSGKLQLDYDRQAGIWVLTGIENLSFRYTLGVST